MIDRNHEDCMGSNPACPRYTPKNKPHIHAAVIKAWADGAEIEGCPPAGGNIWVPLRHPAWDVNMMYRVKPQPHRWQAVIDAYEAGKEVQYRQACKLVYMNNPWGSFREYPDTAPGFTWKPALRKGDMSISPNWDAWGLDWRIKPKQVVKCVKVQLYVQSGALSMVYKEDGGNLRLTFEDGKLIGAEVL